MTKFALTVLDIDGSAVPAIEVEDQLYEISKTCPDLVKDSANGLHDILGNWQAANDALSNAAHRISAGNGPAPIDGGRKAIHRNLLPNSSKIVCAGLNYHDHVTDDLGIHNFDKSAIDPLFFIKHGGSLVAAGKVIPFPKQTKQLDWEVELVVVIGKSGRFVSREDAMSLVAGYSIGFDLSARDWQMSDRHMRKFDLFGGKAFDDSGPVGPKLVPAQFVDPSDLAMKLWVNDDLKQNSSTARMIWSIAELIEAITLHMELVPGDLIFSGSPAGVGLVKNTYLNPGDVIRGTITGLGELVTPIAPE